MAVHHFIVTFNTHTNTWEWDTDTEEARFHGAIYMPETDTWVNSSYSKEVNELDTALSDKLGNMLKVLNSHV